MLPEERSEDETVDQESTSEMYKNDLELLMDLAEGYSNFTGTVKDQELFSMLNQIPDPSSSSASLKETVSVLNPAEQLDKEDSELKQTAKEELSPNRKRSTLDKIKSSVSELVGKASPSRFKSDSHLHHRSGGVSEKSNRLHGFHLLSRAEDYNVSSSVLSGKHLGRKSSSGHIDGSLVAGKNPFWKATDVKVEDSIVVTGDPSRLNAEIRDSVVITPEDAFYVSQYRPESDQVARVGENILERDDSSVGALPDSGKGRYPELEDSVNRALGMEFGANPDPDIFFAENMGEFEHKLESHYRKAGMNVPSELETERCTYSDILEESIIHPKVGEMWSSEGFENLNAFEYVMHESIEQLVDQTRDDNFLFPDDIVGDEQKMHRWKDDVINPMTEYVVAVSGQRLATKYSELAGIPQDTAEQYFHKHNPVNSLDNFRAVEDRFDFAGGDKKSRGEYFLDRVDSKDGLEQITRNYVQQLG